MVHFAKKICAALLFTLSGQQTNLKTPLQNEQRDLIILLDQDNETIGTQNTVFTSVLLGALEQKAAPLLISSSLWHNYIERKQEFSVRAGMQGTQEHSLFTYHELILEQVTTWFKFFEKHSKNILEIKDLITIKLNAYCNKHAENLKIHNNLNVENTRQLYASFACYLTNYDVNEWYFYKVNTYFYVLVPHKYLYSQVAEQKKWVTLSSTEQDEALGINITQLELVTNPFAVSAENIITKYRSKNALTNALQTLLINKDETNGVCFWNIFLAGHGSSGGQKYDGNLISDLSIKEFRNFLQILTTINTRVLYYLTCFGGGKNAYEPYQKDGIPAVYSFPIVNCSLTDVVTYVRECGLQLPGLDCAFSMKNYSCNKEKNAWQLKISYPMKFGKFFSYVHKEASIKDIEELCSHRIIKCLIPNQLESLPKVRLPYTTEFIQYYSQDILHIAPCFSAVKNFLKQPIEIYDDKKTLLVAAKKILTPMCIRAETMPYVISVLPGFARHFIKRIEAMNIYGDQVIQSFWPLKNSAYNKLFLIDEFVCADDPMSLGAQLIGAFEKKLALYNVMVSIEQDSLMRIFFQTKEGTCFNSYTRKSSENSSLISNITPLSDQRAKEYLLYFEQIREQILNWQDEQEIELMGDLEKIIH